LGDSRREVRLHYVSFTYRAQSGIKRAAWWPRSGGIWPGASSLSTTSPQPITHRAWHGNMRALTGDTTAQLNRRELGRHRSAAATPDNHILGFFESLFR
jgi:hypothetical protein